MKLFCTVFFLFFTIRVAAQQDNGELSTLLYPEVYLVIELEEEQELPLVEVMAFCKDLELGWIENDEKLILYKVFPTGIGVEKHSLDIQEALIENPRLKPVFIKMYGREYLPTRYQAITHLGKYPNQY